MKADAVILAGGSSRRMGGIHKGDLWLGDQTFTQRLIQQLHTVAEHIWLSCGEVELQDGPGYRLVRDEYTGCGPMGGLHASLKCCKSDLLLVTACDTPFVKAALYRYLYLFLGDHAGVVAVCKGKIQPLAAIYTRRMLPIFEEQLDRGNYRLKDALLQADVCYVEIGNRPELSAMLQNINTPEDYQFILRH